MSSNKRVIWSEGLFLRPQHFQQQDRYFERYTEVRAGSLRSSSWGFTHLEIERDLLAIGKLGVRRARGVFPDGTPFSIPEDDPAPAAFDIGPSVRDKTAYLTVPIRKSGATDFVRAKGSGASARFSFGEVDARDVTGDGSSSVMLHVGDLATSIRIDGEPLTDLACIPLAHILECRADKRVILEEEDFIPTVLRSAAAPVLSRLIEELQGLLHTRAEELALRATEGGRGGAEIADYLRLLVCNRYEPLVTHWARSLDVHPEDLFTTGLMLAGGATLAAGSRRPAEAAPYEHARLRASFVPLIDELRRVFGTPMDRVAEPIPLTERADIGMWHGTIGDKKLIDSAVFVLAVRADVPTEQLRRYFPAQSKIATVEEIRRYIMELIPGVPLRALPQVPRQIPFHAGSVYFELDTRSPPWKQMRTSGGIAIHIGGQFPGIGLELWAIRT